MSHVSNRRSLSSLVLQVFTPAGRVGKSDPRPHQQVTHQLLEIHGPSPSRRQEEIHFFAIGKLCNRNVAEQVLPACWNCTQRNPLHHALTDADRSGVPRASPPRCGEQHHLRTCGTEEPVKPGEIRGGTQWHRSVPEHCTAYVDVRFSRT